MGLREALDIVLSLAQDNVMDRDEAGPREGNSELHTEIDRQEEAVETVHKLLSLLSENSG